MNSRRSLRRILQINVTANSGSTGRIAEGIGVAAQQAGFESWIAYGRHANKSSSKLIQIGTKINCFEHGIESRLLDNHGLASRISTNAFLKKIDIVKPDLIHLHNIHGYYINYKILFQYIREKKIPIVWTLHDCWPFTGHCSYFSYCGCNKWEKECNHCQQKQTYPTSFVLDRSESNFKEKKDVFNFVQNMTLVSVSHWIDNLVSKSFLKEHNHTVIYNGINIDIFAPSPHNEQIRKKHGIKKDEKILLGVASTWSKRKGLRDFIELGKHLSPKEKIILIGLTKKELNMLPQNIIGLEHTESPKQLAEYYSAADIFLNLTYEDNYPTTNLEAISCGTPCLTYKTGGSIESICEDTGYIVDQGDIKAIINIIKGLSEHKPDKSVNICRHYAENHFDEKKSYLDYLKLYDQITG